MYTVILNGCRTKCGVKLVEAAKFRHVEPALKLAASVAGGAIVCGPRGRRIDSTPFAERLVTALNEVA